jgi:hypothetical protein
MPLPTTATTSSKGAAVAATGNLLGIARVPPNCSLIPCFDGLFGYELVGGVHCPGCSIRESLKRTQLPSVITIKSPPSPPPSPQKTSGSGSPKSKKEDGTTTAVSKLQELQNLQNCVDERRPLPTESSIKSLFNSAKVPYLQYTQSHVTRQSVVVRWPPVLVLQLRRSIWTPDGRLMKVVGHVKFPLALRLEAKDDQKVSYQLQALVQHFGLSAAGQGHYVTFRKISMSSRWVKVSDESVKPVEEAEVLAADAVLLFYEKF